MHQETEFGSSDAIGSSHRDSGGRNFAGLYEQYADLVRSTALRMLRNASEADDATQSVFLKLFLRSQAERADGIVPWLTTVTKNHCFDVLRRRGRHERLVLAERSPTPTESAETTSIRSLEARVVARLLDTLPLKQRNAVVDSYWDGGSHEELAARHAIPLGTLKTRVRDGMQRLRRLAGAERELDRLD